MSQATQKGGNVRWYYAFLILCLSATTLDSREPPQFTCKTWNYPRIVCEAHYVDPFDVVWRVLWDGQTADYDKGVVVYLTLPDDRWATIDMQVLDTHLTAHGRWFNHVVQLRR